MDMSDKLGYVLLLVGVLLLFWRGISIKKSGAVSIKGSNSGTINTGTITQNEAQTSWWRDGLNILGIVIAGIGLYLTIFPL